MDTSPRQRGPVARAVGGVLLLWLLRREAKRGLDAEHPKVFAGYGRVMRPVELALRVAAEVPDDAEAVAAIRAGGGKPKDWKLAAAELRSFDYTWEHRNHMRAARLLRAAADGGPPLPPTADQQALFRAVENFEALPLEDAFALLASEIPALSALEHQVVTSRSEPGRADRDADDRSTEILDYLAQLVGPQAPGGSPLIRSHTAFDQARVYLLGKADLLIDHGEDGPAASVPDSGDGQAEETNLLALLARGYGVRADLFALAKAVSKRVVDHPTYQERQAAGYVLFYLQACIVTKLQRGDRPSGTYRKVMTTMVEACNPRVPAAEYIEKVLQEVRSTVRRVQSEAE